MKSNEDRKWLEESGEQHGDKALDRAPRAKLIVSTLAAALMACAVPQAANAQVLDWLKDKAQKAQIAASAAMTPPSPPPLSPLRPLIPPAPTDTPAVLTPPLSTRSPQSAAGLFGRRVTGDELITELKAIRLAMQSRRTDALAVTLMGSINNATSKPSTFDWSILGDAALKFFEAYVKQQITTISYASLDSYLADLTDRPDALAQESIQMPNAASLRPDQQQRVLTMAALVVSARVTNKVLTQANADFDNVEQDYVQLIDKREKAASVLAEVLDQRRKAKAVRDELRARQLTAELEASLTKEDIEFLDRFPDDIKLSDFANDFSAQNVAIGFLKRKDPAAYADYRTQTDGVMTRTKAYVRTTSGAAAFGAMLVIFGKEMAVAAKGKSVPEIIALMPFAYEFVKESPPLVSLAASAAVQGIVVTPKKELFPNRFRLVDDASVVELRDADAVFKSLTQRGTDQVFKDALFRDGAPGLLQRVYLCDKDEAARLLDRASRGEARATFAKDYLQESASDGSFSEWFTRADAPPLVRNLPELMLRRDQRERADDPNIGKMQIEVVDHYTGWSNTQLLRLIYANHTGPAAHAEMQLGKTLIRPVPSMTAIYEYEAFSESCRALADGAAPNKTPGKKPGTPATPSRPASAPAKRT